MVRRKQSTLIASVKNAKHTCHLQIYYKLRNSGGGGGGGGGGAIQY